MGHFQGPIQAGGRAQHRHGFLGPPLLDQQVAQIFMRLGEARSKLNGEAQKLFRLFPLSAFQECRAKQGSHVDVLRIFLDSIAANFFGLISGALADKVHRFTKCCPLRSSISHCYRLSRVIVFLSASATARPSQDASVSSCVPGIHIVIRSRCAPCEIPALCGFAELLTSCTI